MIEKINHERLQIKNIEFEDNRILSEKGQLRRRESAGVYAIINKINNKFYIGSSIGIQTRWWNHLADLRQNKHENPHLQNSFNKYGEENFCFQIIEELYFEEKDKIKMVSYVRALEQIYLDYYKSYNPQIGYNLNKIANRGKEQHTIEDIKNGKANYTFEQFEKALILLIDTDLSFGEVSRQSRINLSTIKGFYYKEIMPNLMKDFTFQIRTKYKKLKEVMKMDGEPQFFYDNICSEDGRKLLRKKYNCDNASLQSWANQLNIDVKIPLLIEKEGKQPVYCYDLLGNLLKIYSSVQEAGFAVKGVSSNIRDCCNKKQKTYLNCIWSFSPLVFPVPTTLDLLLGKFYSLDKKLHPVIQYDEQNNPIRFYAKVEDLLDRGFLTGEIYKNCAGKTACYRGYYWKYAVEAPDEDLQKLLKNN